MSSRSLNRATIIGNLGKDPELRSTPSGSSVCSFSVATSESYKDRNGEMVDSTDWHNVVLWDRLAEVAAQYLKKGRKIFIEGKMKTRSYDGKDGAKKYVTEIVGQTMIMLDGAGGGGGGSYSNEHSQKETTYSNNSDSNNLDSHVENDSFDDVPF